MQLRICKRIWFFGVPAIFVFSLGGVVACQSIKARHSGLIRTQRTTTAEATKCVRIYYDATTDDGHLGRLEAIFLENLIGHFKQIQQFVSPVEKYKKGDIEGPLEGFPACFATFYLGTSWDSRLPNDFLLDAASTKSHFAWLGANLPQLGKSNLSRLLNVAFERVIDEDPLLPDTAGLPGFFRNFSYKGEVFRKSAEWETADKKGLNAAVEISEVKLLTPEASASVLSWAEHSGVPSGGKPRPGKIPYVIRNNNFWWMADAPFSYVHSADRYLILADLLFDILEEKPLYPNRRPAFVRYEDLHGELPPRQFDSFSNLAKRTNLKFALSVIPEYVDERIHPEGKAHLHVKMTDRPQFIDWLAESVASGGTLLMHGWTHQSDTVQNPLGVSGWDYEFWNFNTDGPMPNDSIIRTLTRLENGYALFQSSGVTPSAWLTPHYMASTLDNFVFGQVFEWSVGGVEIAPFVVNGETLSKDANFDSSGISGREKRKEVLSKIIFKSPPINEEFRTPYEVYGDIYGQGLVPETAGYLNPIATAADANSIDNMIATMKRNRVIRDAWGSYFFHPYMFNRPIDGGIAKADGDSSELERLIRTTRELGYEFVDLKEWILTSGSQKRKPTILVSEP